MKTHALVLAAFLAPLAEGAAVLKNPSFTEGVTEDGLPTHWQGKKDMVSLVEGKGVQIARGGMISQMVPAAGDREYVLTARAHVPYYEEEKNFRYCSRAYLTLTFLPSSERQRVEMVTPFGESRELVEYAIGGWAPADTKEVHVAISAGREAMTLADVQLAAHENSYDSFKLKKLYIDTAIVADGAPAARIVVPASGVHDRLGSRIAGRIKGITGVDVPIAKDADFTICRDLRFSENLIVLGNRNTNQVMSDLYDLYYCIIDLRYPGKGGSVVRSLHDPFGDTHNVIFVGASDPEGMEKAVQRFTSLLGKGRDLKVGYLAEIELGSDVDIPEGISFSQLKRIKPWDATNRTGGYGWTVLTKCLAYYYLTGRECFAREFMRLAFPKDEQTIKDLVSCGQDFRANRREPLVDVYHYRGHLPVVYWDLVEESPFFSDQDRARVTKQFMKQVKTFRSNKAYGCEADKARYPGAIINTRHHQWGAMTFYTLGRYLSKYYPDYEWKAVKRAAEYFFAPLYLKKRFCNRGESARLERYSTTLASIFAYTLMSGNKYPIELGGLHDQVETLEVLLDWQKHAWVLRQTPTSLFNQMAYLFGNSRYARMRELITVRGDVFRPGQSYWPDESRLEYQPFGLRKWGMVRPTRFDLYFWSLLWEEPLEAQDRMVRLASYRTHNDGKGDFLLFDGIYVGGVYHCFSLLEYVLDGDSLLMGQRTHLNVMSDGMTAPKQPKYCLVKRQESLGESAIIEAECPNYSFTDWTRCVLHRNGRYTCFVDTLRSQQTTSSSTVEINWALAGTAKPVTVHPGATTVGVEGTSDDGPIYELNALSCPSAKFSSNLADDKILRSTYDAVTLLNNEPGGYLRIEFDVEREVAGQMVAELVRSRNRGLVKITLDRVVVASRANGYSAGSQKTATQVKLGLRRLTAGRHTLRLESLGRAPDSTGCFISLRGLKVFHKIKVVEYLIGSSHKLTTTVRDMGTAIGSAASGGMVSGSWVGPMTQAEDTVFFSLIAPRADRHDAELGNCIGIAPNAAALELPTGPAMITRGKHQDFDADIALVATDHLVAYGVTRCGGFCSSNKPIDIDWDFAAGRLAVSCHEDSVLALGSERELGRPLKRGRQLFTDIRPSASLLASNHQRLADSLAKAKVARGQVPVIAEEEVKVDAPGMQTAWQAKFGDFPFDMQVFESNGKTYVAVAAGQGVSLFDDQGRLLHELATDALVKAIHYWPEPDLLAAGSQDFKVAAFDLATGKRRWAFESTDINPEMKKAGACGWFDRNPVENRGIHALSSGVFLNGKSQLLVGTASTVEALHEDGRLLKSMSAGAGVVTDIALLSYDENDTRMLAARRFGRFHFQQTSSRDPDKSFHFSVGQFAPRRGASTYAGEYGNGYADIEAVDLDGDGTQELVGLFNGSLNGIHVWNRKGEMLGDAAFGDGPCSPRPSHKKRIERLNMRGLAIADLDGDGEKELCVITSRGFLIVLNWQCEKLWSRRLPSEPVSLAAFACTPGRKGCLLVGCRERGIYRLDAKGTFTARARVGVAPGKARALGARRAVIATVEGDLVAYRID